VSVALYHLSEGACARLSDKDNFVVLDPTLRTVSLAPSAAAAAAAGGAAADGAAGGAATAGAAAPADGARGGSGGAATAEPAGAGLSFRSIQVTAPGSLLINGRVAPAASHGNLSITAFDR
jgi:hypothetical protein